MASIKGAERLNGLNVLNRHCEAQRPPAKITASSSGGTTSSWAYVQSLGFLSVRHLRNVPDDIRPSQETPDPDDDPTRVWREWMKKQRE